MSPWRFVIILLLLLAPVTSWATVFDATSVGLSTAPSKGTAATVLHHNGQHAMVAMSYQLDVGGDDDGCGDGLCIDCACGCDMGVCASTCVGLLGQPLSVPWTQPAGLIASSRDLPPANMRGNALLRPPIV